MRKFKLKKEKYFNKLKKNIASRNDEKYLGRGKTGLDEIDHTKEPELELLVDYGGHDFKDDQVKVPFFSEGYYINELNEMNEKLEKEKNSEKKKEEKIEKEEKMDIINEKDKEENKIEDDPAQNLNLVKSAIKAPMSVTPGKKDFTKRLSTIMKSSIGKAYALDTELKKLSKEFRFLLSGKKMNISLETNVDKKLNFNEEKEKMNVIPEVDENLNESSMEESVNPEEIAAIESDILKKVLKENFNFEEYRTGQLETIKNILNSKNTLLILPPATGKSLCYQVPALVLDGLTIVISPMLSLITDQLSQLPSCLAGASLSGNTSMKQRNEIFEAIKAKKVRILFITPERMAIENFQELKGEVSLICFDEANCVCPMSQSFRSAYITLINTVYNLEPGVMLFLANHSTAMTEEYLVKKFNLEMIKEKTCFAKNLRVTVSKDDNKINALVKMLLTKPYKHCGSTIIFCNLKKNVDKVTSFLNSKGISCVKYHSGLPFIDRQIIQTNFMKGDSKIIVATMGFVMGISKADIRMIVCYDIPPSPEHFIQQVGRGGRDGKETFVHIFIDDEDYFAQRNMYLMENIDKTQIVKFLDNCFTQGNIRSNPGTKRTFSEAFEDDTMGISSKIEYPKTIAVNFNYLSSITGIKRQVQISILMNLLETDQIEHLKIKCIGICPVVVNLRFFKTLPEELIKREENLKIILENVFPHQGIYRVNVMEACGKLSLTNFELMNYFYSLQNKGEVGYDVKDEGMILVVDELPDSNVQMINFVKEKHENLINLNIKKLNSSYVILRKFAATNIEFALKFDKNNSIKCLSHFSNFEEYEKEFRTNVENYFEQPDSEADVEIAGDSEELQKILPIIVLDTQKEKNSISKDIEEIMKKEYEKNPNLHSIDIINILFGIHINETKNFYQSNPLWNRYYQYDYEAIRELVDNAFINVKSDAIVKNNFKKMKKMN